MAHPTTRRENAVEHHAAVQLTFARAVFGHIGNPELVWTITLESPVDEVLRSWGLSQRSPAPGAGQPPEFSSMHEQLDGVMADLDSAAQAELGVDAWGAIGASRGALDLGDQLSQPEVSDRPGRGRSRPPSEVARLRNFQDPAGDLNREALLRHHLDRGELPFGCTASFFMSSAARRVTASSVSS